MDILNNWLPFVIAYLILATLFTQFYKMAANKMKKAGALTVLIELIAGLSVLILSLFLNIGFQQI